MWKNKYVAGYEAVGTNRDALICANSRVYYLVHNCGPKGGTMKFVSVRELRDRTAQLWRDLDREKDLVVTNNGKPVAILTATDSDSFERSLGEIRRSRASDALNAIQRDAAERGLDRLSMDDIDVEIQGSRKRRHTD